MDQHFDFIGVPYGIRTRVVAVRGQCPGPLDEGDRKAAFLAHKPRRIKLNLEIPVKKTP